MYKYLQRLFGNPFLIISYLLTWFCPTLIKDDKRYLKLIYFCRFKRKLNLDNPKTFTEKLQWLKLYNRNPEYTLMTDKVKVKDYVANIIGREYIIPTVGVWRNPDNIDFAKLPNKFVLKCNHNSGLGMMICKDKSSVNIGQWKKIKQGLCLGLKQDFYYAAREWPYKNIPRLILCEEFMEDDKQSEGLRDYKWFCFNGEPKYCQVIGNRSTKETIDFFDTQWDHQPFIGFNPKAVFSEKPIEKPENLELMVNIAKKLSSKIPFSRIDLYEINNKVYFGEITFFPAGGTSNFRPEKYNTIIGDMLHLPTIDSNLNFK